MTGRMTKKLPYKLRNAILLVFVGYGPILGAAPPSYSVFVRVEFLDEKLPTEAVEASVAANPTMVFHGGNQEVAGRITVPGELQLSLGAGLWTVSAEAPGFWSAPRIVLLPQGPNRLLVRLRRTGTLRGRVAVAASEPPPETLTLTFFDPPAKGIGKVEPLGKVSCPVVEGAWTCEIPAGTMDLKLRSAGHISHYVWGLRITANQVLDLGTLVFRRGSSVVGWVETPDGLPDPSSCRVSLATEGAEPVLIRSEKETRRDPKPFAVRVNERGFFHIVDAPPGQFYVIATQPPFAEARVPNRVERDAETNVFQPVSLTPAERFELFVDPPTDPTGSRWTLTLLERGSYGRGAPIVLNAELSEAGSFVRDGLSQGKYLLMLRSESLGGVHSGVVDLGVEPMPLYVNLSYINVKGVVKLGKHPVPAKVIFGGARGAVSVALEADDSGMFTGVLPRAGDWRVEVTLKDPPVHRNIPVVKVEAAASHEAFVSITLPDTTIRGVVVDEWGKPQPSLIMIQSLDQLELPVQERTNPNGEFRLVGLPTGKLKLSASARDPEIGLLESQELVVDLQGEGKSPPSLIRLVVRKVLRVEGRVFSTAGPVPNARVAAVPIDEPSRLMSYRTTDLNGVFDLPNVPPATRELSLNVAAPGFAYRILRAHVTEGKRLDIPVTETAGKLVVEFPTPLSLIGYDRPWPYLIHNAGLQGVSQLREWVALNGGETSETRWVIPQMEPGEYKLCTSYFRDLADLVKQAPAVQCVNGILLPDAELVLKVPAGAEGK